MNFTRAAYVWHDKLRICVDINFNSLFKNFIIKVKKKKLGDTTRIVLLIFFSLKKKEELTKTCHTRCLQPDQRVWERGDPSSPSRSGLLIPN